jgi:predicted DNA-binding protein (MmcQ/YjbR family)
MIGAQDLKELAENFPDATCSEPFEPGVLVFKVADKIFAILQPGSPEKAPQVTLKCDPDRAVALRGQHPAIIPGYHMSKKSWNTVILDGTVPDDEVTELLEHSWDEVVAKFPKARREHLEMLRADRR